MLDIMSDIMFREGQIKTTKTYCLTSIRMATTKQNNTTQHNTTQNKRHKILSVGKNVKKSEPLGTVGGNVKWCSHYAVWKFLKK